MRFGTKWTKLPRFFFCESLNRVLIRLLIASLLCIGANKPAQAAAPIFDIKVAKVYGISKVTLLSGKISRTLNLGEKIGNWTLVGVTAGSNHFAILEDFRHRDDGHIIYVDERGIAIDLPKSAETFSFDPSKLYLGHSQKEIASSATDILARQILAAPGDPKYNQVAQVFMPLQDGIGQQHPFLGGQTPNAVEGFVGTPDTTDKVYFSPGGATANFNPMIFGPSIERSIREGKTLEGLVGGYLPAMRFVYPESDGNWTEVIAFAPFRMVNGNDRIQPVWYRVSRIENGALKWNVYLDSYPPFAMKDDIRAGIKDAPAFYSDLAAFKETWDEKLAPGMKIDVPDERVANMARFCLIASLITRNGDYPKYGLQGEPLLNGYGQSQHDGFQDTFTVQTDAMISWGLMDYAKRFIDNYFSKFVRDDGSILYRGPETGQYGRMLTIVAQYLNDGGDPAITRVLKRHVK